MDVAIFGAGIAGLMSAITLSAQGHHCRIFERNRQAHEAGMGFILMSQGIGCLQSFGVNLEAKHAGVPLARYCYRGPAGDVLQEQAMPAGSRSFRRRDLIAALTKALSAASVLTFDTELEQLRFDEAGNVQAAHVKWGGRVVNVRADLYVAADGIGSLARSALFPGWPTPPARVPEVVGLVRCRETVRWTCGNFNKFHAPAGGLAVGVLPVDSEHLVWFLQFDAQRFPPPRQEEPEACRAFVARLVGDWGHPVPHLVSLTDFSRAHVWLPVESELVPCLYRKNLVLIGDAAHPLIPLTSQGLSSALADAVALARALRAETDLETALASYSDERREQCRPYVAKGRELTRQFLQPQGVEDVVLPMA